MPRGLSFSLFSSAAVVQHRRNGRVNPSVRHGAAIVCLEFVRMSGRLDRPANNLVVSTRRRESPAFDNLSVIKRH
jgi:hypothetical protein